MIFMDRAAQKVESPNKLFARRLSILLGFGIFTSHLFGSVTYWPFTP